MLLCPLRILEEPVCRRPLVRCLVPEPLVTVGAAPGFLSTYNRTRGCRDPAAPLLLTAAPRERFSVPQLKVGDSLCCSRQDIEPPAEAPRQCSGVAERQNIGWRLCQSVHIGPVVLAWRWHTVAAAAPVMRR